MISRNVTVVLAVLLIFAVASTDALAKKPKKGLKDLKLLGVETSQGTYQGGTDIHWQKPTPPANAWRGSNVVRVAVMDTLGFTTYDFAWNQVPDQQVALATGGDLDGIHMTYMWRTGNDNATGRFATYNYYSKLFETFLQVSPGYFPADHPGSGWPRVADGPTHQGIYSYHRFGAINESHYRVDDVEGGGVFSTDVVVDNNGTWPGIDVNGSTAVFSVTDATDNNVSRLYASSDIGITWDEVSFAPHVIFGAINYSTAENMPMINPVDNAKIGLVLAEDNGVNPDNIGGLTWNESSDMSANPTWDQTLIYNFQDMLPGDYSYDPYGSLVGGNTVFHFHSSVYSSDGTAHMVFAGNGMQFDTNGDSLYPIHQLVYWNNRDQQLVELSDPAIGRHPTLGDSIDAYFPARNWGMSYNSITTGPNGELLAAWTQAELEDENTLRLVVGNVNGLPSPETATFHGTDIWGAYSGDNGLTWSAAFKLAGTDAQIDQNPQMSEIEIIDDSVHVHLLYMWDTNPGGTLDGESDTSTCAWVYNELVIVAPPAMGIEDDENHVTNTFQLQQNYPNPFNPSTTISFNMPSSADVTLEVFNLLGEKVATLANGHKTAGQHDIEFDARDFSSGIYFYTLTANDFSQTRKMVLMK